MELSELENCKLSLKIIYTKIYMIQINSMKAPNFSSHSTCLKKIIFKCLLKKKKNKKKKNKKKKFVNKFINLFIFSYFRKKYQFNLNNKKKYKR